MKKTLIICLSLLAVIAYASRAQASAVIKSVPTGGLAAYWTFDGNSINWGTNTVFDKSGNGYNGTPAFMSASGNSVAGKVGQALYFNGSVTSIGLSSIPLSSVSSPNSACAWANDANLSLKPGGFDQTILGLYVNPITGDGVRMGSISSGNFFVSYQVGGAFKGAQSTAGVFTNNSWTFVCYVWDGGGITLYANGVSLATTTNADSIDSPSTIGADNNTGWGVWDGDLDEVRVYSRALTAAEVLRIYQSSAAKIDKVPSGHAKLDTSNSPDTLATGLVGYWPFDGKTVDWKKNQASDLSGQGNTGQLINMSTTTSPVMGKIGQAFKFNGTSQYISLPVNTPFTNDASADSISVWFKSTGTGVIISDNNNTPPVAPTNYDPLLYIESTGILHAGGYVAGFPNIISASTVNDGKWHNAVYIYDGSGSQSLYLDGAFVTSASGTMSGISGSNYWYIGTGYTSTWPNTNNSWYYFSGSLDDVRVYNRALSATEVKQLYLMGK